MKLADALFAPRAVALFGASADATKNTARPQRYLRKHGYGGRVVPINPARAEVLGARAYASLADAPGEIDHAFIMVPAAQVEAALEQCAARGVPVVTVYSDGFVCLFRRPVYQHDPRADQQRRAEECRAERLGEQDHAEGDDHRLIHEARHHLGRERDDAGLARD